MLASRCAGRSELLGGVAVGADVGRDVLHGALVVDAPAEGDHRAGDEQVTLALQVRLGLLAADDLVGERALPLLEQHDHGVERLGELAHEVDALRVVAARDLLGLAGELAQPAVHLDERPGHPVVGDGSGAASSPRASGMTNSADLLDEPDHAVDRAHQWQRRRGAGRLADVDDRRCLQQLGERVVDRREARLEVVAGVAFHVRRHDAVPAFVAGDPRRCARPLLVLPSIVTRLLGPSCRAVYTRGCATRERSHGGPRAAAKKDGEHRGG